MPPKSQALRLHKALVAFLTTVYLFVGLVHASAHVNEVIMRVNEAIPATISLDMNMSAGATDVSGDADLKKSSAAAEYCQVYAPCVMPTPTPVATPRAHPAKIAFVAPRHLLEDHPKLDTPPPKHLA